MGTIRVSFLSTVVALIAFGVTGSSAGTSCTLEEMAAENLQKLAKANNELALNLLKELSKGSSDNIFFSPLSLSTAFAMLFYGARGGTAEELRKTLGYSKADISDELVHVTFQRFLSEILKSGKTEEYVLNAANAILLDKHFELVPDYKGDIQDLYKASVKDVDFLTESGKAVNEINQWVREKTNGKIDKLLDELSPSTVMVLLNAVYFKGTWRYKFDPLKTKEEVFYNNGLEAEAKKVPLMNMKARLRYASMDGFQVLELPYKGDNISMLVLLPDKRDGLRQVEEGLTREKLEQIRSRLYKTKVSITLPKFKVEYSKELSDEFKHLGANGIFSAGSANFSGMTPSKNVFVSQVLHKAVVEVNEEGSEAAAVTGIISNRMRPIFDNEPEFRADHPFLFTIVESGKSNMLLFLGRVNKL